MIKVTRFDNSTILINVNLIQSVQATPDTVITFTTRESMMVKEPVEKISRRILEYQRSINNSLPHLQKDMADLEEVSVNDTEQTYTQ